jgi:hypothetical protein
MKNLPLVITIAFCWGSPLLSQQSQKGSPKLISNCAQQKNGLASGAYVDAVLREVRPPTVLPPSPVSAGIKVAVQFASQVKVFLYTDGHKFELLMGTANVPGNNVWSFLEDVADSCSLPPDPADAVKLLKIKWNTKELSQEEFVHLHADFMAALTSYISTVRERADHFMTKQISGGGVDASYYTIMYDNSWEHLEINELDLPLDGQTSPMIKWVHDFQKQVERTFHVSIGRKE